MTEGAEARVANQIEGEKSSQKEDEENWDANDQQDALPKRVPFAKSDVRNKDNCSRKTKQ